MLNLFNLCIQVTSELKGIALRLLGIDFLVGWTNDIMFVEVVVKPSDNILIGVQVYKLMLFIGRQDALYAKS